MSLIKLPESLYKFVTWEKSYHKDIIIKNEVFFSSAKRFNDPFDSSLPLRYDLGNERQILELYKRHLYLENPFQNPDNIEKIAKDYIDNQLYKDPKNIEGHINFQKEWTKNKYGIFVLTKEYKNILMWSHYSDSHKGICIRFNVARLKHFIENDCVKKNLLITWHKIEYKKNYPLLNPFHLDDIEVVTKPLIVKSIDWKYENEYRFILFDYPDMKVTLPEGIIDQIILGCKMDNSHKKEVLDCAKKKSIPVMESKIKDNFFGLEFNAINNL